MKLSKSEYVAVVAALAALVFLGWMLVPPGHARVKPGVSAKDQQAASAALLEGRWRAASTGDAEAPDAAESLRAAVGEAIGDPDRVLTQEQRRLLSDAIARELLARSVKDPAEFLRINESTPGVQWIGEHDADQWEVVDIWYAKLFHEKPSRDDPRGVLSRIVESQLIDSKNRIIRYGKGEGGLFIRAYRVRSEDQINDRFADYIIQSASDYWLNAPSTGAALLRKPVRSFGQVLREENMALVGASLVTVGTEGGWTYVWYCYWYWDGSVNAWQIHTMSRKGEIRGTLF